jgi:hypothetical protein
MRKLRWFVVLQLSGAFLACGAKAQKVVDVVPFDLIDNRIFVNAKVNGQGPFHLLLDTGAAATLRMEVAAQLGLVKENDFETGGVGSGTVSGYRTHLRAVEIGKAHVEDIESNVLPFDDTPAVFGTARVDGYIGYEFFEKYVVKHDYENRTVTFLDAKTFQYAGSGEILRIEATEYVPVVEGKLDGVPAKFGIDTGARSSLIVYGPYVASHGLREKYKPKFQGVTGWGIGGPVRSEIARIDSVELGGAKIDRVVARFSLNKTGATAGNSKAGLIGPDILKRFTVICDYKRKRLILEKNKNFVVKDTYDKAGVWLIQNGTGFEVMDVIAGGPAEKAGLRVGDHVVAVDGVESRSLVLPEVRDRWKYADAGTKVRLKIAGNSKEVVLTLVELV